MVPMYMTSCLGLVVEYHVCVSVAMEVKKNIHAQRCVWCMHKLQVYIIMTIGMNVYL